MGIGEQCAQLGERVLQPQEGLTKKRADLNVRSLCNVHYVNQPVEGLLQNQSRASQRNDAHDHQKANAIRNYRAHQLGILTHHAHRS